MTNAIWKPCWQGIDHGIEIQRAENRHHYRSVIYGLLAVFNVIVSIYLCQIWGAVGAAIGTGAACVLGQGITMNIVYHKKINIDMLAFWKAILRQLIGMLPAFVVGALLTKFVPVRSWLSLIGYVSLYAVVYAVSVWFFSMDGSEKAIVKSIFAKLIKRRAEK